MLLEQKFLQFWMSECFRFWIHQSFLGYSSLSPFLTLSLKFDLRKRVSESLLAILEKQYPNFEDPSVRLNSSLTLFAEFIVNSLEEKLFSPNVNLCFYAKILWFDWFLSGSRLKETFENKQW